MEVRTFFVVLERELKLWNGSQTFSAVKSLALASLQAQNGITSHGHHFGLERHLACWEGRDLAHGFLWLTPVVPHPQGSNAEDPTIPGVWRWNFWAEFLLWDFTSELITKSLFRPIIENTVEGNDLPWLLSCVQGRSSLLQPMIGNLESAEAGLFQWIGRGHPSNTPVVGVARVHLF